MKLRYTIGIPRLLVSTAVAQEIQNSKLKLNLVKPKKGRDTISEQHARSS
jgi:hypothetical protein